MSGEEKQAGPAPRVCFLLDEMSVGGVQALIIILCRRLLAEGCQVDLVRLAEPDQMLRRVPGGVRTMLLHEAPAHPGAGIFAATARFFAGACPRPVCRFFRRFRQSQNAEHDAKNDPTKRRTPRMQLISRHIGPLFTVTGLRVFLSLWTVNRRLAHPLSLARVAYFSACSCRVARYIETEKPDVMYSAWGSANITALLGRRAARRKPRLIISVHNAVRNLLQKPKLALMSHFIVEADAMHTVSEGVADEVTREYGVRREKIMLVHNPVFHEEILDLKKQKCDHPWIAQKGEEKVLLWAGRAAPQKDLKMLLRAFRILSERRDARLILLGAPKKKRWMDGETRELYESVKDRTLLPGYAENPYSWMAGADAFVLSSQWEGLPTVLIEALGCGCPVVSTDCEHGPREILGDGRWGRLTPVGDSEALADAIDATLDNPPPAEALVARARDFSLERIMPQFMEMLGLPRNTQTC